MTFDELYRKLEKFVHWLAHAKANGAFLMDHQEISSELFEEMVKGYARYGHLPEGELVAVIKTMMDNRISKLTYIYYVTHRAQGNHPMSLSGGRLRRPSGGEGWMQKIYWSSVEQDKEPEDLMESKERVQKTRDALSPGAQTVFNAVLYDNPQLARQLTLSGIRASYVYDNGKVRLVKPWQVAESLAMSEKAVRKAFREIKQVYSEVLDEV